MDAFRRTGIVLATGMDLNRKVYRSRGRHTEKRIVRRYARRKLKSLIQVERKANDV